MANKIKRKRRLRKVLLRRKKELIKKAWRYIFVKSGLLDK